MNRKFNFPKQIYQFEKELRQNQKEIFKRAEVNYDLSDPPPEENIQGEKADKKEARKMKVSNMSLDELRAKKRLNNLEEETMGSTYGFLIFDDL